MWKSKKKIWHNFGHSINDVPSWPWDVMYEVSVIRYCFVLYNNGTILEFLEMSFIGVCL